MTSFTGAVQAFTRFTGAHNPSEGAGPMATARGDGVQCFSVSIDSGDPFGELFRAPKELMFDGNELPCVRKPIEGPVQPIMEALDPDLNSDGGCVQPSSIVDVDRDIGSIGSIDLGHRCRDEADHLGSGPVCSKVQAQCGWCDQEVGITPGVQHQLDSAIESHWDRPRNQRCPIVFSNPIRGRVVPGGTIIITETSDPKTVLETPPGSDHPI